MDHKQALEFLAVAARQFYPIGRLDEYNAAIKALASLIEAATPKKPDDPKA